eukprot:COSAG06_NODE_66768_length_253_cov_1.123377_1_plen_80_part_10
MRTHKRNAFLWRAGWRHFLMMKHDHLPRQAQNTRREQVENERGVFSAGGPRGTEWKHLDKPLRRAAATLGYSAATWDSTV